MNGILVWKSKTYVTINFLEPARGEILNWNTLAMKMSDLSQAQPLQLTQNIAQHRNRTDNRCNTLRNKTLLLDHRRIIHEQLKQVFFVEAQAYTKKLTQK